MILGIDVGGTHTDSVLMDRGRVVAKSKVATDKTDILGCVLRATRAVTSPDQFVDLTRIVLSTTILTNAVVQSQLDPVGLVVMTGPGVSPRDLPLAGETTVVSGYMNHRGIEARAPDQRELRALKAAFDARRIDNIAVVGKFSSRNPRHEIAAADIFAPGARHVSLGHQLSGQLDFPRRISTAYLNEAVWNVHARFVDQLAGYLAELGIDVPLYILKADGGTIEARCSRDYPVQTILSGPAATIMGVLPFTPKKIDSASIDIGGTTTDIALFADGVPLLEPRGVAIGGHKTLIRGLSTHSIGLGGDSRIRVTDGRLDIGPQREGPAMAFGGPCPTPTDAMIFLGRTAIGDPAGAAAAMDDVARRLGATPRESAEAILAQVCDTIAARVRGMVADVNARPVYTIHEMLEGKTLAPQQLTVVGGPAPCLADQIGAAYGVPAAVPEHADVINARGAATARTTVELNLTADTEAQVMNVAELGEQLKISSRVTVEDVVAAGRERLARIARAAGARAEDLEIEVTDCQSFNVVRGFATSGRNIRVRLQIKPGLISPEAV